MPRKARDAAKLIYPIMTQYWVTHAVWVDSLLEVINMAMNDIRIYKWYNWTWQHWKDNFTSLQDNPYRIITTRPIREVDGFYCWEMLRRDWFKENILCSDCDIPQWVCAPCTPCACKNCEKLDLCEILPQNEICPWTYAITWSEYEGMGWFSWQIIRVSTHKPVDSLRVTYRREFSPVESFDDDMPIPRSFGTIMAKLASYYIMWRYGQFRPWEENNLLNYAQQQLEHMREADQKWPKVMDFKEANNYFNSVYG